MLKSKKLEDFTNQRLASAWQIAAAGTFAVKNARRSFGNRSRIAANRVSPTFHAFIVCLLEMSNMTEAKTTRRLRVLVNLIVLTASIRKYI
jgi:hypothetical protein